jgi:hypothetical protein
MLKDTANVCYSSLLSVSSSLLALASETPDLPRVLHFRIGI